MAASEWRWRLPGCSSVETAMCLVLAAPFLSWWLWPGVIVGLLATRSLLALLALTGGTFVLIPWAAWHILAGLLAFGLHMTLWGPRLRQRWHSIQGRLAGIALAILRLTWRGHGRGSMARDLRRWRSRQSIQRVPFDPDDPWPTMRDYAPPGWWLPLDSLFCEPIQVVYEYGAVGGLALAGLVTAFLWSFTWGSSWSAAGVTFGILSLGHAPARVMARWLRKLLPDPPFLAELVVHVAHDGTFRIYTTKLHGPTTVVADAFYRASVHWGQERGLQLEPRTGGVDGRSRN
jgi:hypothetical protein